MMIPAEAEFRFTEDHMIRKEMRWTAACMSTALLFSALSTAAYAAPRRKVFADNVSESSHQTSFERERSAEEWAKLRDNRIEWDEIQTLVHEYNPTIASMWISFRQNDHRGAYHIDYEKAEQKIEDAYQKAMEAADGNEVAEALAEMRYQSDSARSDVDSNAQSSDREAAKLQIEQSELTTTETIRKSILSMYSSRAKAETAKTNIDQESANYDAAVRKLNAGQGTNLDVLNAKEAREKAQLSLSQENASVEKNTELIRVDLGWRYNDEPELPEAPIPGEEQLNALDLQADTETALKENYPIRITERKLAVSQTETQLASLNTTLQNQKESVRADMISRYQAVKQARTGLEQARLQSSNLQAAQSSAERAYSVGSKSRREMETAKNQAESAKRSERIAELSLAEADYDYLAGKQGLAKAGGSQ